MHTLFYSYNSLLISTYNNYIDIIFTYSTSYISKIRYVNILQQCNDCTNIHVLL